MKRIGSANRIALANINGELCMISDVPELRQMMRWIARPGRRVTSHKQLRAAFLFQ
jgi:hypothetical protein